ncbi:unnamed protein product [Paramecium pentaurelia]|uniref:Peptidase A1 domain-containing protein n=1 Tax=Paramecium pentaurelia TaxID=43138 RepID=A0A8S1Y3B0_9CILI|nr:unnamed protein product [Paramecium pentaurelia]
MKKHSSENQLDYCVFYKDKQLPALHKTDAVKKALIIDSLNNYEHPLNQLIEQKQTFVPFINERDSLGRLISSESYHRKRKSDASSIFNSPKSSHHFLSKNSISNTSSLYENQLPITRLKLKNLLGGTPENTELIQSTLLASQSEFKQSFQFNPKYNQISQRIHRKNNSLQNKLPQFQRELKIPQLKLIKQPTTPQATRLFQSNFVIEMFNQNKIPEYKMQYVILMESMSKFQIELLKNMTANERRRTFVKLDKNRRFKLIQLLISVACIHFVLAKYTIFLDTKQVQESSFLIDINSTQQEQNKTLELQNFYNYQYVGQIRVLSKDSILHFKVIFDTGSSQMWLPSIDCQRCNKNQIGIVCEQPTCIPSQEQASITYHVGALIGVKCLGMFSINEHFDESQFILVDEVTGMEGAIYDGVVGLQQQSNHSFIEWPISFYYNFENSNRQSSITFGGYDENVFNKEIRYVKSDEQWIISSQQIDMNGILGVDIYAMIDSGSSLLIFPKNILVNLQNVFTNCVWTEIIKCSCPTNDISEFPTIKILLDSQEFSLEPQFYIHTNNHEPICYVLISNIRSHNDQLMILGSPFMRKYYTIFDKQNSQIGLVESIHFQESNSKNLLKNFFTLIACTIIAIGIIKIVNYIMEYELRKYNNQKSLMV